MKINIVHLKAKIKSNRNFLKVPSEPFSFQKEAFMTLRVTHENENNLAATDHSIMFKRVSISA